MDSGSSKGTASATSSRRYLAQVILGPPHWSNPGWLSLKSDETSTDAVDMAKGWHQTPEAKAKISAGKAGKSFSPEHRAAIGAAKRGRSLSPETRAKISAALVGRRLSPERRAAIAAGHAGKPLSTEHRARISAGLKGKRLSPEHEAKVREGNLGKIVSAETRARMSASLRGMKVSDETRVRIQAVARERFLSAEVREHMRLAMQGKPHHPLMVECADCGKICNRGPMVGHIRASGHGMVPIDQAPVSQASASSLIEETGSWKTQRALKIGWCDAEQCRCWGPLGEPSPCGRPYLQRDDW